MTTFTRRCLSADQVAAKLGLSSSTFHRQRTRLVTTFGFPPPLHVFRPGKTLWDEKAIDLWLDRQSGLGYELSQERYIHEVKT